MRVVVLKDCDANADDRELRRALFLGQSYDLTDAEAEPLLAAGTVAVEDAVRATTSPSSPESPGPGGEGDTDEPDRYPCPVEGCDAGPEGGWKNARTRDKHVADKH